VADLTLNGRAVLRGTLSLHRTGAWRARLEVDGSELVSGAVTVVAEGGARFRGVVTAAGDAGERIDLEVWGGAGGLTRSVPPQFYRGAPLRLPLGDVLRAAGETLSPRSDRGALEVLLPRWALAATTGTAALDALVATVAGATWRVLADGTVWVGRETWPAVAVEHDLLSEAPARDQVVIGATHLPTALVPGVTFLGRRVSVVHHVLEPDSLRTTVLFESAAEPGDRARALFRGLVRETMADTARHRLMPARVVLQNGDGTLDVQPDDTALPAMTGVPLLTFLPGVTARVVAGARVVVGFAEGDARRPVALAFESGALSELTIATQGGATLRLTGGDVHVLPGGLGSVMLGTTNPVNQRPVAAGGDAVASAAVTPVPSRKVLVPL
jgi:hypothetical protein